MLKKRFMSMLLVVSMLMGLGVPCLAAQSSDRSPQIISNTANERVAEIQEGCMLYQAHFDKHANTMVVRTYQSGTLIEEKFIDLNWALQKEHSLLANIATPVQSETGFGYLLGESISDYSASDELVDNGTYPFHAIRVRNTSVPTTTQDFRGKVDAMIEHEKNIRNYDSEATLMLIVGIVTAYLCNYGTAFTAAVSAVGASIKSQNEADELAKKANSCAQDFAIMYSNRVK